MWPCPPQRTTLALATTCSTIDCFAYRQVTDIDSWTARLQLQLSAGIRHTHVGATHTEQSPAGVQQVPPCWGATGPLPAQWVPTNPANPGYKTSPQHTPGHETRLATLAASPSVSASGQSKATHLVACGTPDCMLPVHCGVSGTCILQAYTAQLIVHACLDCSPNSCCVGGSSTFQCCYLHAVEQLCSNTLPYAHVGVCWPQDTHGILCCRSVRCVCPASGHMLQAHGHLLLVWPATTIVSGHTQKQTH